MLIARVLDFVHDGVVPQADGRTQGSRSCSGPGRITMRLSSGPTNSYESILGTESECGSSCTGFMRRSPSVSARLS